jgi:hypothetical protein
MNESFVISLWTALSPTEYKSVLKFLDSPFHNQREDVTALARLLAATPTAGLSELDKQLVFQTIFPGQAFDNLQFNYTCSFLVKRLEAYLTWKEMELDTHTRNLMLSRALRRRGAYPHYLRVTDRSLQHLEDHPLRNAGYYLARYLLERERYQHQVLHQRETPTALTRVTVPLDRFFILENLRWAGTALSLEARYGVKNELPFAEAVFSQAAQAGPVESPEILALHLGYQTLKDIEQEDNFRNLKVLIGRKGELFSPAENRDLYLLAINFCLRRHNRGERPAYTREALNLYREALERGLLFENNLLQKFTYNNILRLACIAGEWIWAKSFLEQYRSYLPEEDQENTYRFNLASWHYLAGEYVRVPALLQTFEFADRDTQLNARQMLLRSFFELQEWQALDSLLRSFYSFLRRRHDIGYQRLAYLNLIKFTRKIMSGRLSPRKAARLAERIRAEQYVTERDWLLEKVG